MKWASQQLCMFHLLSMRTVTDISGRYLCLRKSINLFHKILQIKWPVFNLNMPGLQLTHIQNIIDQCQQMLRRNIDFLQTVIHFLMIVSVPFYHFQHSHHTVDRCTDIMAHSA